MILNFKNFNAIAFGLAIVGSARAGIYNLNLRKDYSTDSMLSIGSKVDALDSTLATQVSNIAFNVTVSNGKYKSSQLKPYHWVNSADFVFTRKDNKPYDNGVYTLQVSGPYLCKQLPYNCTKQSAGDFELCSYKLGNCTGITGTNTASTQFKIDSSIPKDIGYIFPFAHNKTVVITTTFADADGAAKQCPKGYELYPQSSDLDYTVSQLRKVSYYGTFWYTFPESGLPGPSYMGGDSSSSKHRSLCISL